MFVFLFYLGAWLLFAAVVLTGLATNLGDAVGGGYSNTDGEWARWNGEFLLRFGNVLDFSPFNAFAGLGSVYLPNLPWFNPGALALGLPVDPHTAILVSFFFYMLQLALSIVILARAFGFSWPAATIAAQLHIFVLFPPFSHFFKPMEWYSAAPMYAQLASVLNLAFAAFIGVGRGRIGWTVVGAAALAMLVIAGLVSAPFSFVFFFAPYVTLGLVWLATMRPRGVELTAKLAALALTGLCVVALGYPSYLDAMAGTSARAPQAAIDWGSLLSFEAWRSLFERVDICSDPRALICKGHRPAWLQVAGAIGALELAVLGRAEQRALGFWGVLYTLFVVLYAYLFASGWLGPLGVVSVHFVSWSSYSLLCICAVAGSALLFGKASGLVARSRGLGSATGAFSRTHIGHFIQAVPLPRLSIFGFPVIALLVVHSLISNGRPFRRPQIGPVVAYLQVNDTLGLGGAFPGYTSTVWSKAMIPLDPLHQANVYPHFRFVGGRMYFERFYGTTFMETDLWSLGIPTLEEYGQWVSRQAQFYVQTLMGEGAPGQVPYEPRMLRIYEPNLDLMRTLGVRYVITDAQLTSSDVVLRARQDKSEALSVLLYELRDPNLATYSPSAVEVVDGGPGAVLDWVRAHSRELDRIAAVEAPISGPFLPAEQVEMQLIRDGYRITASSPGRSLVLLPLQFSNCLKASGEGDVEIVRANFLQAMLVFSGTIDVSIQNTLGLLGKAACGKEDAQFAAALPY